MNKNTGIYTALGVVVIAVIVGIVYFLKSTPAKPINYPPAGSQAAQPVYTDGNSAGAVIGASLGTGGVGSLITAINDAASSGNNTAITPAQTQK